MKKYLFWFANEHLDFRLNVSIFDITFFCQHLACFVCNPGYFWFPGNQIHC